MAIVMGREAAGRRGGSRIGKDEAMTVQDPTGTPVPETGLELLTAVDVAEADRLGRFLVRENDRRRRIERSICDEARALIGRTVDLERDRVIVLGAEGWHAGVIGIVASRITEEFFRPTLIVAFDGDREINLAEGQRAQLTVTRSGPWVIDPRRTLTLAAERGLLVDLPHWEDPYDGAQTGGCC